MVCVCVEEIFHSEEKNQPVRKTRCIGDAVCCKCWTRLFLITILILHGKVAVDDISAFYLPHFTFFMSFKMFLARFACHMAKMNGKKR